MARLLQISQLGNPILRERAEEVGDVNDPTVQALIDDMLVTVADAEGVGIAAPQVYRTERIFIVASKPNKRYPKAPDMDPTAMINPEILWKSDETEKDWEGCLSIPGIRGKVPRPTKIGVRYVTREEETVETEFEDFVARVFQHELDHLDGVVFLDRLESTQDIVTEREYQKLMSA